MNKLAALLAALVLLSGCSTSTASSPGRPDAVQKPEPLPDVTLQSLTPGGKAIDLGSLKGPAVINLWASWCKPCTREMPIYEKFHQASPDVPVIGINSHDTQRTAARRVARDTGVTYPLVVDADTAIRAIGLPRVMLVGADGQVVWSDYREIKSLGELEGLVAKYLGAP